MTLQSMMKSTSRCVLFSAAILIVLRSTDGLVKTADVSDLVGSCWNLGGKILYQLYKPPNGEFVINDTLNESEPLYGRNSEQSVISPVSLLYALSAALLAASDRNDFRRSMLSVVTGRSFHAHDLSLSTYASFPKLSSILRQYGSDKLSLATNIFPHRIDSSLLRQMGEDVAPLNEKFRIDSLEYFDMKIMPVDYINFPSRAISDINQWASDNTGGLISHPLNHVSSATRVILMNALFFNMDWKLKFARSDTRSNFKVSQTRYVNYTRMIGFNLQYKAGKVHLLKSAIYSLPYANDSATMYIIMPRHPDALILHHRRFCEFISSGLMTSTQMFPQKADSFTMPKFLIRNTIDLNKPLKDIGLGRMFQEDFNFFESQPLSLTDVTQEAVVDVSESGTSAAAVTTMKFSYRSYSPYKNRVSIRKPFIYAIVDNESQAPLFVGRVLDPSLL